MWCCLEQRHFTHVSTPYQYLPFFLEEAGSLAISQPKMVQLLFGVIIWRCWVRSCVTMCVFGCCVDIVRRWGWQWWQRGIAICMDALNKGEGTRMMPWMSLKHEMSCKTHGK